jgi:hypothetical protein
MTDSTDVQVGGVVEVREILVAMVQSLVELSIGPGYLSKGSNHRDTIGSTT